jgi:hypothetical protein
MEIVLISFGNVLPDGTAEACTPIVNGLIKPIIIIAVRVVLGLSGLYKPLMLIGGMVGNEVHYKLHTAGMHFTDENAHIVHSAEFVHYIAVIGNVISVVLVGAFVAGAKPDSVYAEIAKIIQLGDNTFKIADTVIIGILKAAGIYLIYYEIEKA